MARAKAKKPTAGEYALKFGHPTEFRRTVQLGDGDEAQKVQLVFQPNAPLKLSAEEVEGLKKEIDTGFIVPWQEDEKGRQARPRVTESTRIELPPEGTPTAIPSGEPGVDIEHKSTTTTEREPRRQQPQQNPQPNPLPLEQTQPGHRPPKS